MIFVAKNNILNKLFIFMISVFKLIKKKLEKYINNYFDKLYKIINNLKLILYNHYNKYL